MHAAHHRSGGQVHARKDHGYARGGEERAMQGGPVKERADRPKRAAGGWIGNAIKHPGALTAAAKKAGESTHEFVEAHKHATGKTGQRARLALTLGKMRH